MKVRIPTKFISENEMRDGVLKIGYFTEIAPSKKSKTFWQFDNMSPADLDCWLDAQMGDYNGVKIDKANFERFPFLQTF